MRVYKTRLMGKKWCAITLGPIGVFVGPEHAKNPRVLNHERIHWEQQKRDMYVWFYIKYLYEAITRGYRNISYEVEAYAHEDDPNYHPR